MSRRQMMTFIEGRQSRANSSQRAASFGPAWRFTRTMTFLFSAMNPQSALFCRVIPARPRRDQRNVHRLVVELDLAAPLGARGFQPILVITLGEIGFVVRA